MTSNKELSSATTRLIASLLVRIEVDSPPKDLHDVLSEIAFKDRLRDNLDDAQELVDDLIEDVRLQLDEQTNKAIESGTTWNIELFGTSREWIRGAAFSDHSLPAHVNNLRARRAHVRAVKSYLCSLKDTYIFEGLCTTILKSLGCYNPRTSWRSNDGGIDFYGRLPLQGRMDSQLPLGGFDRGAGVWLIGQAKHCPEKSVGVGVIREMVGSVELARTGSALREWPDLDFRPFDPVIILVFTTGYFSSKSNQLLSNSGMLSMDGDQLATYLCDAGLGFEASGGDFVPKRLLELITKDSNPAN